MVCLRPTWFLALLGLSGLNILAAAVVRFPWKKSQIPFVITHAGCWSCCRSAQVFGIQIFGGGIEGTLALQEGETGERMVLHDSSRFRVEWMDQQAGHGRSPWTAAAGIHFSAGAGRLARGKAWISRNSSGVRSR